MDKLYTKLIMLVSLVVVLSACATAPKVTEVPKRFFWPPEPDQPRIEWIAAYYGDLDIKTKGLLSSVVGDDATVEFSRPISVASDGEGRFIVADQELAQVYMFNLKRHEVFPLGGTAGATSFSQPSGVAVDGLGYFYAADTKSRKIFVADGENKLVRVIDLSLEVASIGSIAIDRARSILLVPDPKSAKVALFTLAGELRSTISGKGYFSFPNAVAVASDGSVFVADSYNATIVHFSADGKYISALGKRGDSPGNLTLVTGVAVDSEDHVYAVDGRLHSITIFDKEGNTLMVIGGQHSIRSGNIGRGGFQIPQGISIDKNDRIFVADSFNHRVQVLQYLNEKYLRENPVGISSPKK
jgi:sugar lactone lactonase YvrE